MSQETPNIIDRDDAPLKHYIILPAIIRDLGLSIYAKELYTTLRAIVGAYGGNCYQSRDALAKACGMSSGQITKAKAELVQAQLIEIVKRNPLKHETDILVILPIRERNNAHFLAKKESSGGHTVTSGCHTVTDSDQKTDDQTGHQVTAGGREVTVLNNLKEYKNIRVREEKNRADPRSKSQDKQEPTAIPGKKESSTMLTKSAPTKKPKASATSTATTDSRSKHPAIAAVRGLVGRYPNSAIWDDIITLLGDSPDLDRLRECFKRWCKVSTNVSRLDVWLFDWYANPQAPSGTAPGSSKLAAPANSTSSTQEVRVLTKEDIDKIEAQQRRLTDYFPPTWRKGFEAKVAAGKVPGMALAPDYYQTDK